MSERSLIILLNCAIVKLGLDCGSVRDGMQLGGSAMARPGGDGSREEGCQATWDEEGEVRYTWAGPAGNP